jgi:PAS domain S-box-containing protein
MSIRRKFLTLLSLLMICMVLLSVSNNLMLKKSMDKSWELVDEHFQPALDEKVPHLNKIHQCMGYLLSADKEAFVAMMSLQNVAKAGDEELLKNAIRENQDSILRMLELIELVAQEVPNEHSFSLEKFYHRYNAWIELNKKVTLLSDKIWSDYSSNKEDYDKVEELFNETREQINVLADSMQLRYQSNSDSAVLANIAKQLYESRLPDQIQADKVELLFQELRGKINQLADSMQARMDGGDHGSSSLGDSVAYVLNADRDTYQVMYAEHKVQSVLKEDQVNFYRGEAESNLKQIRERLDWASDDYTDEETILYKDIQNLLEQWALISETMFERIDKIIRDLSDRENYLVLAMDSFKLLREVIEESIVEFDHLVNQHLDEFDQTDSQIQMQIADLESRMRFHQKMFFGMMLLTIFIFVAAFLLQRRLVTNLIALSDYFRTVGVDQLQKPFVFPGRDSGKRYNDELDLLQSNLNRMRERLNEAILGQKHEEEMRLLYERIISSAKEPMIYFDHNCIYRAANDEVLRRNGISRKELIGKSIEDVMGHYKYKHFFKPRMEECLKGKEVHFEGWVDYRATGAAWMYMSFYPYYESDGTVGGVMYVGSDLTELKRAQEKQSESEKRYSCLFNNQYAPMLLIDPEEMTIVDANPAAENFYGYTKSELLAIDYRYISKRKPEDLKAIIERSFKNEMNTYESVHILKDRRLRDVLINIVPVYLKDRSYYYAIIQDITEQKRWEEAILEARDQAEVANKAKDEFLAVMSHELRTPLNPILGFSSMLMDEVDSPEMREYLTMIRHSSEHLLGIIDSILKFSKLNRGDLMSKSEPFRIMELVDEVYGKYNNAENGNKLTVTNGGKYDCEPISADSCYYGVSREIYSILEQLVSNAVRFTENGEISLFVGIKKSDSSRGLLTIEVSDTGIGMSKDQLDLIFNPFVQADSSMTRSFGGIGLGLSICRKLLDLMGGVIEVESELHKGSCFKVFIPLDEAGNDALCQDSDDVVVVDIGEYDVLVVEDNHDNLVFMEEILKELGGHVDTLTNGVDVKEQVEASHYDIIFMDLNLPGRNGMECARDIREHYGLSDLPIIGFTAYEVEKLQAMEESHLFNEVLEKPLLPQHIKRCLSKYL